MPRRSLWTMGLRALALIVVSTCLLLVAAGGAGAATESDAAAASSAEPVAAPAPDASKAPASTPPLPAAQNGSAEPPPGGQVDASAVTISRAGSSALRTVSIVDFAFDPAALTVKVGDTVQWINSGTADEGHNVIGDGLQSPVLHSGESYSFTFSEAGSFSYVCTIHPKMTGTVEVVDPSADSGEKTQKPRGGKSSSPSGGGGSSDSSASSSGTSGSATAFGSESEAGRTVDAAGTSSSLPSTGADAIGLSVTGLLLIALGLALRLPPAGRLSRRG